MNAHTLIAAAAGATAALGLALLVRSLWVPRPGLAERLTAAFPPAATFTTASPSTPSSWTERATRQIERIAADCGFPTTKTRQDLAVSGRTVTRHIARYLITAVMFAVITLLGLLISGVPTVIVVAGTLCAATFGAWAAHRNLVRRATARRDELRNALSAFLELTVLGLNVGNGIDQALTHAISRINGWGAGQIDTALRRSRDRGERVDQLLHELGSRYGVDEFTVLAHSMEQAGEHGARISKSIRAQAHAMRRQRRHANTEHTRAATEVMWVVTAVSSLLLMALLLYPAFALLDNAGAPAAASPLHSVGKTSKPRLALGTPTGDADSRADSQPSHSQIAHTRVQSTFQTGKGKDS